LNEAYKVPSGYGEAQLTEKHSRFIGRIWPADSEEEALVHIKEMREKHWDATHNVYAYIIREGSIMRYSDDGEPQGTSGMPTLNVLRSNGLFNVCCVVTRYFGGILLGTGGLVRAYSQTAALALEAAGTSCVRLWDRVLISAPYPVYERVRKELLQLEAMIENTSFGTAVELDVLIEKGMAEKLNERLLDISSGAVEAVLINEEYKAVKIRSGG
jgi:uncharacterized YigZ family protein